MTHKSSAVAGKRAYHAPKLEEFGSVSSLTAGTTNEYPYLPEWCEPGSSIS